MGTESHAPTTAERPGTATRRSKVCLDCLWFLAWALVSSVWCVTAAAQLGATYDEPFYVRAGLEGWRVGTHKFLVGLGTMPLATDLDTLPLYLWERCRGTPFDPVADLDTVLPWARAGTLLFWWLLLFYGWRVGRQVGGAWGGRLAVALLACEPSLLAHAGLATTDIAFSACLLALLHHFRCGREGRWFRRIGVPSFWLGATLLAKASGLLFAPVCLAVVELERLARRPASDNLTGSPGRSLWKPLLSSGRDLLQVAGLGLVLVFVYCSDSHHPVRPLTPQALRLPAGPVGWAGVAMAEHVRSLETAFKGLTFQVNHNVHGHGGGAYLLGEYRDGTFWYYFPTALCIKLSLSLLALLVVLFVCRARAALNWPLLAAAALLVLSPAYRVQIGIRLVLPLVTLGIVGLSGGLARTLNERGPRWNKSLIRAGATAAVCWGIWSAVHVWPDGLCYTNELWGGTGQGYRCLTDSNYDWGQGLKELARWQRQHRLGPMDVWYFGTDPAVCADTFRPVALDGLPASGPGSVAERERGHYLAAGTSFVYGWDYRTEAARFLRSCRPVGRTATFLIYHFEEGGDARGEPADDPEGRVASRDE